MTHSAGECCTERWRSKEDQRKFAVGVRDLRGIVSVLFQRDVRGGLSTSRLPLRRLPAVTAQLSCGALGKGETFNTSFVLALIFLFRFTRTINF